MLNVLVVDDDKEFRAWVTQALADMAAVFEVATPTEALWALERRPVDVLLCDLRLATLTDGLDVLSTAKELWPGVGRILVTSFGHELGDGIPAHAILGKPCDAGTLRELLCLVPLLAGSIRGDDVT